MEELNTNPVVEESTTQTAATQPETTLPQAVTVDMDAMSRIWESRAERAAISAVRDTLKQQGHSDDGIKEVLEELKNRQTASDRAIADLKNENAVLKQEKVLRRHGLTDNEDIEIYSIRIGKLVTADKPFDVAAKEYFEAHPRSTKVPATATYGGTGRTPMTSGAISEIEAAREAARKAMKIK